MPPPPVTSLASMRLLVCISLMYGNSLNPRELKLLSSLPVLASLVLQGMQFDAGDEETLAEWLAVSSKKQGMKRKLEVEGEAGDEKELEAAEGKAEVDEDEEGDELFELMFGSCRRLEEQAQLEHDEDIYGELEDPFDPSLPQRHSLLLLFLHALASKPLFVHLRLHNHYDIDAFVMDHMPVWSYCSLSPLRTCTCWTTTLSRR